MLYLFVERIREHSGVLRWLVACAALVPIGALLLGCASLGGNQGAATAQSGPRISFEKEKFDFGLVPYNREIKAEFKVRNTGSDPLLIQDVSVRTVQGC